LNYADRFFTRDGCFWEIEIAYERVVEFINAAKNSGWKLEIFIDLGIQTEETMTKWRERREENVRFGK